MLLEGVGRFSGECCFGVHFCGSGQSATKGPGLKAWKAKLCAVTEGGTSDLLYGFFAFIGGSMGNVGEKIQENQSFNQNNIPFVMISKSGGARMMEAAYSLMQLAKRP
jgi:acetyl-CoA carboxylase carboxyl transferase subunit beta